MDQYTQLYAWINYAFGEEIFSMDSFKSTFPSSQAPKIIHDLVKDGYIQRISRGNYQAVSPNQLIENIVERSYASQSMMELADRKYAFSDSTAVAIWTSGYYWTGFTKGFRPIHVIVLSQDVDYWKTFFKDQDAQCAIINESRTLFGFVYILHPQKSFDAVDKEGKQVIPLEEVVQFCLEREDIYQPALEYLDENFGIGYQSRAFIDT